jgi:Mg/Co/Ni transporter MgtE
MDRNFHKLFQKMEELEKKDIIEDTHKKIKKEAQDKKDKNNMIIKERLIGAVIGFIFTLIFSLIVYISPL